MHGEGASGGGGHPVVQAHKHMRILALLFTV